MYVRMYVCVHVCMYVCMYVCVHVCIYVYVCMYACMYVCMYVYKYLPVLASACVISSLVSTYYIMTGVVKVFQALIVKFKIIFHWTQQCTNPPYPFLFKSQIILITPYIYCKSKSLIF